MMPLYSRLAASGMACACCSSRFTVRVSSKKNHTSHWPTRSLLDRILGCDPLAIASAGNVRNPGFMLQIPADCFANAAVEGLARSPAQLALDLTSVHGVAAVMAGPVLDERDQ